MNRSSNPQSAIDNPHSPERVPHRIQELLEDVAGVLLHALQAHRLAQFLHQLALPIVELVGDDEPHRDQLIAAAGAAQDRDTLAADSEDRPVLCAGREWSASFCHPEVGTSASQPNVAWIMLIGSSSRMSFSGVEQRMRLDVQEDVQAARRAVAIARFTLARQANPHAVIHPGRDRDRQPPGHAHTLLAPAIRARRRRDSHARRCSADMS